jgi:hypothetical protein
MDLNNTIESHSSLVTNKRVGMIFIEIDRLGLIASNTLHISNINAYYNVVEQLYINIKDVLGDDLIKKCEDERQKYSKVMELVEDDASCRTKKASRLMVNIVKQFNSYIVSGLQKYQYLFRLGIRETKGLKNINFFEKSIFKNRGEKDEGKEHSNPGLEGEKQDAA